MFNILDNNVTSEEIVCKMNGRISSLLFVNKGFYDLLSDPHTVGCVARTFEIEIDSDIYLIGKLMRYILIHGNENVKHCLNDSGMGKMICNPCSQIKSVISEILFPLFRVDTPVWYVKLILNMFGKDHIVDVLSNCDIDEFENVWFRLERETLKLLLPGMMDIIHPYYLISSSECYRDNDGYNELIKLVIDISQQTTDSDQTLTYFILNNKVISDYLVDVYGFNVAVALEMILECDDCPGVVLKYIETEEMNEDDRTHILDIIGFLYSEDELDESDKETYERITGIV